MRWTPEEDAILAKWWGARKPKWLVSKLGRSLSAIKERAKTLGVRRDQGTMSLRQLGRVTGYTIPALKAIIRAEGIKPRRIPSDRPYRNRRYSITDDQAERIANKIIAMNAPARIPGVGDHHRAIWGVKGKPTRCHMCGTRNRPYKGCGLCDLCYSRATRRKTINHYNTIRNPL
jgi:hypothetical protein